MLSILPLSEKHLLISESAYLKFSDFTNCLIFYKCCSIPPFEVDFDDLCLCVKVNDEDSWEIEFIKSIESNFVNVDFTLNLLLLSDFFDSYSW